jgi:hypothetical protein
MRLSRTLSIGVLFFAVPSVSWATTWNVAQTACSDTTCAPCCTIQAAVERSGHNDVVSVAPGTYVEQVDFRGMSTVGDITLRAASGPGTVMVSPSSGRALTHAGFDVNTVTVESVDFASPDMTCVFLAHSGDAVLRDVTAVGCGNHGFEIDATGSVTLERCAGNSNVNKGIQGDGSASVSLTDCTAECNTSAGIHVLNVSGAVDLVNPSTATNSAYGIEVDATGPVNVVNPTSTGNAEYGIGFAVTGSLVITGGSVTTNGNQGIWPWVDGTISIGATTISENGGIGIDVEGLGGVPVGGVDLSDTAVVNNGHGSGDPGVRLRDVVGLSTVSNCSFDSNGFDGLSVESSVVGDLVIVGGHADGNADDGFDLRNVGNVTATGVTASGNTSKGFAVDSRAVVDFQSCVANDNVNESGFTVDWQDPETVDGVTFSGCTANGNGLSGGGEGIHVRHVSGSVAVTRSSASGNSRSGIRVQDSAATVLVRDTLTSFNLGDGIELAVDGQLTIVDNDVSNNSLGGLDIDSVSAEVASLNVRRNAVLANLGTGVALSGLAGSGPMRAMCNDIVGNGFGMYLDSPATVDARKVWWGDATGPGGSGPGLGDGVLAEPGGSIDYSSWQPESVFSGATSCEFFGSGFETGLLGEWDVVVD